MPPLHANCLPFWAFLDFHHIFPATLLIELGRKRDMDVLKYIASRNEWVERGEMAVFR